MKILVLGGDGFVGKAVCQELKKHKPYVLSREGRGKNHIKGNVTSSADLKKACKGIDIVINLVGLSPLQKPKEGMYEKIHVEGVKNIIEACRANKIKHLIHMSVLGASTKAETEFLKTRGKGEELIEKSGLNYTIFKPSLIFDKENELIEQLQKSKYTCTFPMIPAKVQPIYRKDIAKMFGLAVEGKIKEKKLELGGPEKMTLYEMAEKFYKRQGFPCLGIPLPLVKAGMGLASSLDMFRLGEDQIKALTIDNTTKKNIADKYLNLMPYSKWLEKWK